MSGVFIKIISIINIIKFAEQGAANELRPENQNPLKQVGEGGHARRSAPDMEGLVKFATYPSYSVVSPQGVSLCFLLFRECQGGCEIDDG